MATESKHHDDEEEKQSELQSNKKPKSYDKCPPIQFIVRDNKGWRMYKQDTKTGQLHNTSSVQPCNDADIVFSEDGKYFAVLLEDGIQIYKTKKSKLITFLKHDRVRKVHFSPLNKILISYHHRRKDDQKGNCLVWKWSKKETTLIHQFFVSELIGQTLPFVLTNNECIAAQVALNEVLIYDMKQQQDVCTSIGSIDAQKVVSVSVAPCPRDKQHSQKCYVLAIFAMATSTKAATVTIYQYDTINNTSKQISQRQFFGIQECAFLWEPNSQHNLLVMVSSDVDSYGKSYYGNQELFLMTSQSDKTIKIQIKNKLQDVKWCPLGKEFVAIDGDVISVFDQKGTNIYCIGQYTRNRIRFSPCGMFLWVGGFGNLTGEMTFYDYQNIKQEENSEKDKYLAGYNRDSACRYFEWSPDSSLFVTASIYPYMTVDNGFTIYKYNGFKLYEEKVEKLCQVAYRPSLYHVYPDKSVSIKALAQSQALPQTMPKEVIAKTKYVPPHLRNKGKKRGRGGTKRLFG
eukprot:932905_1